MLRMMALTVKRTKMAKKKMIVLAMMMMMAWRLPFLVLSPSAGKAKRF